MGVDLLSGFHPWIAALGVLILLTGEMLTLKYIKSLSALLILSTVAETGYVLLGFGTGTYTGITGSILHLEYQAVMRGLVFAAAAVLIMKRRSGSLDHLRGIIKSYPLCTVLFSFGLFSVIGLSPFKGSISKFLIIYSAIQSGHLLLAALATLGSIIEAWYCLVVVQKLCFEQQDSLAVVEEQNTKVSPFANLLMFILAGMTVVMSLFPEPFIHFAQNTASLIMANNGGRPMPAFETPWPVLVLLPYAGGFAVYLIGLISHRLRNFSAVFITALTVYFVWNDTGLDSLSRLFAFIMAAVIFLVTLYSVDYLKGKEHSNRYFFFLLMMLGSLLGLSTSKELGNFYTFWELMTWSSYFLVVHEQTDKALKAGFKYFMMCTAGAYIMHFGILTLHVKLGTFDMSAISANLHLLSPALLVTILILFITGFGVKAGLFPFHSWLPDAHPVAPSSISAPMSGILTKAGVYGLIKILFVVFGAGLLAQLGTTGKVPMTGYAISVMGAITVLYGDIMALRQTDLKKLLAFSTLAQVGEIVLTLGTGTYLGMVGGLYHVLNHAIMKTLLFLAAGALIFRLKSQDVDKLRGIGRVMPWTSLCFAVGILSIMGLPPFNGFISKFLMVYALVEAGRIPFAVVLLAGGVIGSFYYLKLIRIMFYEKYVGPKISEAPWTMSVPVTVLALLALVNGLYPQGGLALVKKAADLIALRGGMPLQIIPQINPVWTWPVIISMMGAFMAFALGKVSIKLGGWGAATAMLGAFVAVIYLNSHYDILSTSFALLIAFMGILNLVYSVGYMDHSHAQTRYYLMFLLMIGGLLGVALSKDLFSFFVFWEIMSSWSLYLVIIHEETPDALREGFKYFFFNYTGATLVLLGLLLLTVNAGTFQMNELAARLNNLSFGTTAAAGIILVLAGFAMKAAMLPFRIDYQMHPPAAPTPVSGYISSVLLKSAPFGMIKLFYIFGGITLLSKFGLMGGQPAIMYVMAWVGGITLVMAASLALLQSGMKRLLIYHTVSQMGYIVLGISLGSSLGMAGGLLHLLNHMLFKNLLFLAAGAIMFRTGIDNLDKLGGIGKKMPVTLTVFAIGAFSIAGIPPFNGFVSKLIIYLAAMDKGYAALALLSMLGSVLTLASFMKFLHSAFFGQLPEHLDSVREAPWTMLVPMMILAILCIVLGIIPGAALKVIALIITGLGLPSIPAGLFGIESALGNMGILTVLIVTSLTLGLAVYLLGNSKVRVTEIHTCGVASIRDEEMHVNSHNLYPATKQLIRRLIRAIRQVDGHSQGGES
ncbi:proton-conducting transporter membrane subunit [Thermincola potens]|uniref:NADH/Ubiquinone/plastoquinone (Complex I) n=1 Tax=Thermincola potens (strain JR) TaxID=635013 RepID=D5XDQ0_THEPJ|nr:proton-conducting transporter membrane subunit [Thermincola potens]ADG83796.1 NADH/Ubiquinone/plastoquinone (complex I) [Thermincola potens JR]